MMSWLWVLISCAQIHAEAEPGPLLSDQIQLTHDGIVADEKLQREALSHLFVINRKVKEIAHKQELLTGKMAATEGNVKALAQEVVQLENRREQHQDMLNKRLRQLYQERGEDGFHWLFSAQSPVELERNHRFLRRMIDSDHRQLKVYLEDIVELRKKRVDLKASVEHLIGLRRQMEAQEKELALQLREKSRVISQIEKSRDAKLSTLKGLRHQVQGAESAQAAFFERKGLLTAPVDAPISRTFGTYVDAKFRYRLMQKGTYYSIPRPRAIHAVYSGHVAFAAPVPGYGLMMILNHGDNYYSVYAFASKLMADAGNEVHEGDVIALSGPGSPLFGPGLYFEIRHFTDAIDPRPWIKDSVLKTAED